MHASTLQPRCDFSIECSVVSVGGLLHTDKQTYNNALHAVIVAFFYFVFKLIAQLQCPKLFYEPCYSSKQCLLFVVFELS